MNKFNGNCECKKISFDILQEIKYFSHCHCSQCRRSHGSAFASFIEVDKSCFKYISGKENLKSYTSSEQCKRIFCSICGSNIMFIDETKSNKYYVSAGAINGNPKLPSAHHVFVGSKASWYEIHDDLKQHYTLPSSYKNE
tara:strand:- start:300 stop:719 length:420 start_codon:yes stop_codon:yes gene_type:complete